ncbi:MAG: sulfur carrier protein ThiS [Chthoniobacterales bacterium]
MNIFLNDEPYTVIISTNIAELVIELNLHPATVLIEHNGIALHRDEWVKTDITQNDRIEILHVVAGG